MQQEDNSPTYWQDEESIPVRGNDIELSWKERIFHFVMFTLIAAYGLFLIYAGLRWVILPVMRWMLQYV